MSLMSVELVAVEIRKTVVIKYGFILLQKTKTEDNSGSTHLTLFLLLLRKLMISKFVPNIIKVN